MFGRFFKRRSNRQRKGWPKKLLRGTIIELTDFEAHAHSVLHTDTLPTERVKGGLFTVLSFQYRSAIELMRYQPRKVGMVNHTGVINHLMPEDLFNLEQRYMIPRGKVKDSQFIRIHRTPPTNVLPQGTIIRVNPEYQEWYKSFTDDAIYHMRASHYEDYEMFKDGTIDESVKRTKYGYTDTDWRIDEAEFYRGLNHWTKTWFGGVPEYMKKRGGVANYLFSKDGPMGWNPEKRAGYRNTLEELLTIPSFYTTFLPHSQQMMFTNYERSSYSSPTPFPHKPRMKDKVSNWIRNKNAVFLVANSTNPSSSNALCGGIKQGSEDDVSYTTNASNWIQYLIPLSTKKGYQPYAGKGKYKYNHVNIDSLNLGFLIKYGMFEVIAYRPELMENPAYSYVFDKDDWRVKGDNETTSRRLVQEIIDDPSQIYAPLYHKDWMGADMRWSELPEYQVIGYYDEKGQNPYRGNPKLDD